jgi:hypothetical protein
MPVLSEPAERRTTTLPPRPALIGGRCDVLVVGGGPGGLAAAFGAARAGADVILAERYGFLGGNATVALVMPWMSFHTQRHGPGAVDQTSLFPTDHGPGDPVVGGAFYEFYERLIATGGAMAPSQATGFTVPFDPELFKVAAMDVLDDAGVRMLFHAFASGILGEGEPRGVVFETKSGPIVIEAPVIVDGTGDGDIAALSGAAYEVGRETDGLVQPMTLMMRIAGFDRAAFTDYVHANPSQWKGVHGLWDLVAKATEAGELDLPREDVLFFATPNEGEVAVNSTRVTGVLGTNVFDLSRAEYLSHRQARQIARFLKSHVPGFERAYSAQTGSHVGVRETRRVLGDYVMQGQDIVEGRKFEDAIARSTYPMDIHNPTGRGTLLKRVPPGDWYEIPLRSLLPHGVDRVLVAGRCISGTHEAHSSYRVTPTAMATGHAAGVCAALAKKGRRLPREIPAQDVQDELRRQGASLR